MQIASKKVIMTSKEQKYIVNQTSDQLNTGELLKKYFLEHRIRKAALARAINRNKNMVLKYQKQSTIQVAILWEISVALKHNFFADIASKLPPDFTTYALPDNSLQEKIMDLETKLKLTEAERDVLLKAMK